MANPDTPHSSVRILVVDDFEPWRQQVCSILQIRPGLRVVAEIADGLEAVQKAEELQPDLIVLDIGLPLLNGIEVARRVRKVSPKSKILFVSQESSADVVQEALRTGARGYVLKTDAGSELLIAINVVLRGEQFVSRRLADQQSTDNSKITPCHEAGFYSSDQSLLDHLTQFIGAALKRGNAAIVIATESHRENLFPRLQEQGLDMTAALEQGRYAGFDAGDTLSMCMQDQCPMRVDFHGSWQIAFKQRRMLPNRDAIALQFLESVYNFYGNKAMVRRRLRSKDSGTKRYSDATMLKFSADTQRMLFRAGWTISSSKKSMQNTQRFIPGSRFAVEPHY